MKISTVHAIQVPRNERENQLFGYFSETSLGLDLSKGKGWYGSDGNYTGAAIVLTFTDPATGQEYSFLQSSQINVITSKDSYLRLEKEKIRQSALAKLTHTEREILGLS